MSNRRRPARGNTYRSGYLKSVVWFTRRTQWFRDEAVLTGGVVRCAICSGRGDTRSLELHHLDYTGVAFQDGRWVAGEAHLDLVAMHPDHHRIVHELIDRDPVLRNHRTRREANRIAISKLRNRIRDSLLSVAA